MSDNSPRKRRWFQIHLSTAVVLMKLHSWNRCVLLLLLVVVLLSCGKAEKFPKNKQAITLGEELMPIDQLPFTVSPEVQTLYERVNEITPILLVKDLSRQGGSVSENVDAQLSLLPSKLQIRILFYSESPSEEHFAHELLHADYILRKGAFFYIRKFPVSKAIANLENSIQHVWLFSELEELGFSQRTTKAISELKATRTQIEAGLKGIPSHAPQRVIDIIGVSSALDGLALGMDEADIRRWLPERIHGGIPKAKIIHDLLKTSNYDVSKKTITARIECANILGLTSDEVVIGILDFKNRKRHYYDLAGSLVITKDAE